jgi:hypothetical protein
MATQSGKRLRSAAADVLRRSHLVRAIPPSAALCPAEVDSISSATIVEGIHSRGAGRPRAAQWNLRSHWDQARSNGQKLGMFNSVGGLGFGRMLPRSRLQG